MTLTLGGNLSVDITHPINTFYQLKMLRFVSIILGFAAPSRIVDTVQQVDGLMDKIAQVLSVGRCDYIIVQSRASCLGTEGIVTHFASDAQWFKFCPNWE